MRGRLLTTPDFCGLGPIYFRAASWAAAEPGNFARILEKQNRLQMTQVFPFSCIDDQMGVVFQGFYKRGRFTQAMLLPRGLANREPENLTSQSAREIFAL